MQPYPARSIKVHHTQLGKGGDIGQQRRPGLASDCERANLAKREPERLAQMRQAWEDWNASMPAIPEDATISLGYSYKDMPQR